MIYPVAFVLPTFFISALLQICKFLLVLKLKLLLYICGASRLSSYISLFINKLCTWHCNSPYIGYCSAVSNVHWATLNEMECFELFILTLLRKWQMKFVMENDRARKKKFLPFHLTEHESAAASIQGKQASKKYFIHWLLSIMASCN